jgi:uncharacterized protein YraI
VKRHILKALAVGVLMALPSVAAAATNGFATANVNMRSGPSTSYPAVVVIPAGAPIVINGCLNTVNWCDVSFARGRGWVSGNYIQTSYRQNRVYVAPQYYRPLGIPTITFDVDTYWQRHYRERDFYRERDRWRGWDYRRTDAPPRWDDRRPAPPPPRWDDRRPEPPRWDDNRRPDRPNWDDNRRPEQPRWDDNRRPDRPNWDDNRRPEQPRFDRDRNRDNDGNRPDRPRFDDNQNRDRDRFDRNREPERRGEPRREEEIRNRDREQRPREQERPRREEQRPQREEQRPQREQQRPQRAEPQQNDIQRRCTQLQPCPGQNNRDRTSD